MRTSKHGFLIETPRKDTGLLEIVTQTTLRWIRSLHESIHILPTKTLESANFEDFEPSNELAAEEKLKLHFRILFKNFVDEWTTEFLPSIFHEIIKVIIHYKSNETDPILSFDAIATIFYSEMQIFLRNSSYKLPPISIPIEFLPKTFNFVFNSLADDKITVSWLGIGYWSIYFHNLPITASKKNLRFEIRQLILLANLKRQKKNK